MNLDSFIMRVIIALVVVFTLNLIRYLFKRKDEDK